MPSEEERNQCVCVCVHDIVQMFCKPQFVSGFGLLRTGPIKTYIAVRVLTATQKVLMPKSLAAPS